MTKHFSPFRRARSKDISRLRRAVEIARAWERRMLENGYVDELSRESRLDGAWVENAMLWHELETRVWERLADTKPAIASELLEQRYVANLRRNDRAAYETYLLRQDLARLIGMLEDNESVSAELAQHLGELAASLR